jgi:hypothetical protein
VIDAQLDSAIPESGLQGTITHHQQHTVVQFRSSQRIKEHGVSFPRLEASNCDEHDAISR